MKISLFLNAGPEVEIARRALYDLRTKMRGIEVSIGLDIKNTAEALLAQFPKSIDRDCVLHLKLDEIGIISEAVAQLRTRPMEIAEVEIARLLHQKIIRKTQVLFEAQAEALADE